VAFLAETNRTAERAATQRGDLRFQTESSKTRSKSTWLWLLLLLLTGTCDLLGAENAVSKEYQVKAAFLYNFSKFVEWPAAVMPQGASPIVVGVFGKNPFGAELEKLVRDKTINEHPIKIRQPQTPEDLRSCHMVFVSDEEGKRLPELLAALKGASVLTVGESQKFAELGGIINFVQEDGKLRFEINGDSAVSAGLRISAQLLKLAKTVRGAREIGRN